MVMLLCIIRKDTVSNLHKTVNGQEYNGMTYGELIAKSEVLLSVALGHLDSIIDIPDGHGVVGNVLDTARATSTLQVGRQGRGNTRPDLDASTILDIALVFTRHEHSISHNTYRGIEHRNVVDENVLNDIDFVLVLA
jgi:hypothetical protein